MTIFSAPVGYFKLLADGSTAVGPNFYPTLEFDIITVAGQNNTLGTPIYLPADDVERALPGRWRGTDSEAGWGTWAVLRRA